MKNFLILLCSFFIASCSAHVSSRKINDLKKNDLILQSSIYSKLDLTNLQGEVISDIRNNAKKESDYIKEKYKGKKSDIENQEMQDKLMVIYMQSHEFILDSLTLEQREKLATLMEETVQKRTNILLK